MMFAATLRERAERLGQVIDFGARLKALMIKQQKSKVRAKCPDHPEKFVHARLAGPRMHLHMWCDDTDCRFRMME